MKKYVVLLSCLVMTVAGFAQAYAKLKITRGDTSSLCNNKMELRPYGATAPYGIQWWDNHWAPSSGLHAENLCVGTTISTDTYDQNCNHLRAVLYVFPDHIAQVELDTVIATVPSHPDSSDGRLEFRFFNVTSAYTRKFGNSGSGGTTNKYIFTGLKQDDYHYSIHGLGSKTLCEVTVPLWHTRNYPCNPHYDSLVITPVGGPGQCNAGVTFNTQGSGGHQHYIYKPVGGGSVVVNPNPSASGYYQLCPGPHIVHTHNNNPEYFHSYNHIYIDNPLLRDSTWGNPGSSIVDTIRLQAITNCGVNYTYNVDTMYISKMTHIGGMQFEIEISVLQNPDTIRSYENAFVDTSHALCFDVTLFCADSVITLTAATELHSYLFYNTSTVVSNSKELDSSPTFTIQPNPSGGQVAINNIPSNAREITILGLDGRVLKTSRVSASRQLIDLSHLSNGVYIVAVSSGVHVHHKKLLISR